MDSTRGTTHTLGDYAYDAIYVGGIGGGLVALFFLVLDVVTRGEPLFTPSSWEACSSIARRPKPSRR